MPSAESSDGSCSGTRLSLRLRARWPSAKTAPGYGCGWDLTGDVTQPIQWSSEYSDEELGLVYYNYRHLNPHDGRWTSRDSIEEQGVWNLFAL